MASLRSLLGSTFRARVPTVTIGTVTTVSAETPAAVTNVGNSTDLVLNFAIPAATGGSGGSGGVTTGKAIAMAIVFG